MPERPIQHVIAAKSVAAVSAIWLDTGAAVEEVKHDYGEDLLIQTTWQGDVDPSRIWVQVKGRTAIKVIGSGTRSLRVSADHAMRWASSADTVVVVLWDVSAQKGWYALPRLQIDPIELFLSGRKHVSLKFEDQSKFNLSAAKSLVWDTRISHYFGRFLVANEERTTYRHFGNDDMEGRAYNVTSFVLFELLYKFEAIGPEGVPVRLLKMVRNGCDHPWEDCESSSEARFSRALQLVLLGYVKKAAGCGLPPTLLIALCQFMRTLILSGKSVEEWLVDPPARHSASVDPGTRTSVL